MAQIKELRTLLAILESQNKTQPNPGVNTFIGNTTEKLKQYEMMKGAGVDVQNYLLTIEEDIKKRLQPEPAAAEESRPSPSPHQSSIKAAIGNTTFTPIETYSTYNILSGYDLDSLFYIIHAEHEIPYIYYKGMYKIDIGTSANDADSEPTPVKNIVTNVPRIQITKRRDGQIIQIKDNKIVYKTRENKTQLQVEINIGDEDTIIYNDNDVFPVGRRTMLKYNLVYHDMPIPKVPGDYWEWNCVTKDVKANEVHMEDVIVTVAILESQPPSFT